MTLQLGNLALERCGAGVRDRRDADPDRPHALDLLAWRVEERALLARILVEVCKGLSILPLGDQRDRARCRRARLEAAEALFDIGEPVAAFRVFALVHEIEADFPLLRHHPGD